MKRNIIIGFLLLVSVGLGSFVFQQVSAQNEKGNLESFEDQRPEAVLLTEDFTYTAGSLLSANGWTAYSAAGTNALTTSAPGLTYTGYSGSGVGNAVTMATSGEDASRPYAPQTTGVVYASVLANLSDAANDPIGGYFFHIGADPVGTAFRCRLFAKKDASNNVSFGISKASTTEVVFTPSTYSLNTTYLLVVKYTIVAGDTNDTVDLFVNPVLGGNEPAVTATATDVTAADIVPGTVSIRQGTAGTSPTLRVDGIKVGTAWADIAGGGAGPTPTPTPAPTATPTPAPTATPTPAPTATPTPAPSSPRFLFTTRMLGSNEVPANASTATGFGRVVLNAAETQITASFYWEGLTTGTTGGHIHTGAINGTGPVTFDMTPPTGVTRGSVVDKTFSITPAQVATLRAGGMYFNVHSTTFAGGEIRGQLVGVTNDAPLDFNGDGRTDFGVVRQTTGAGNTQIRWYNLLNNAAATEVQTDFGVVTDYITPGDFDGDGKDDIAIWRPQTDNSFFYILQSSTNTLRTVRFGMPNDDPFLIADYDGDGVDDPAIFRKGGTDGSQSFFWWYGSFGTTKNVQVVVPWGVGADVAAPGDYNGDGKADFCVFRGIGTPARGLFFIHYGTGLFDATSPNDTVTRFGLPTDAIVPGDYDGDGKTDLALTRVEGAALAWYYQPSTNPTVTIRTGWGRAATDIEVQGDYDGDGKTDQSIWRSSTGNPSIYYVLRSSDGSVQYQFWGLFGDQPAAQDSHL